MSWKPRSPELAVPFPRDEWRLYRLNDPSSTYSHVRWPLSAGRGRFGEFPLVVVREHFRKLGYTVWASEPELPDQSGFILVSYPGKRRARHPAYLRMMNVFGEAAIEDLNRLADALKRQKTGGAGGGDPDLFVFRGTERFFVEVKWRDKVTAKQQATFPLIERLCNTEVKLARLFEADGSVDHDAA